MDSSFGSCYLETYEVFEVPEVFDFECNVQELLDGNNLSKFIASEDKIIYINQNGSERRIRMFSKQGAIRCKLSKAFGN